jgi:RND family efflux transporter MFP subunit
MHRLLILCLAAALPAAQAATAPVVRTVAPEPAATAAAIRLPARTAPVEQARLYARVTGQVSERRVDIGDMVRAGDLLAVIAAPETDREADRARALVAQAAARTELAQANLRRTRLLGAGELVSQEDGEVSTANAASAEADLLAAQAELRRLEQLQAFQRITAPFPGIVTGRRVERGDFVQGDSAGDDRWLFQLARIDELRVLIDAPPAAAIAIRDGMVAAMEFTDLPGQRFSATVARRAGVIDPVTGAMRSELHLPNPDLRVPAGLNGTATIRPPQPVGLLRVPVNAVVVRGGEPHVAVVRDGRIAFQPVSLGRNLGQRIEIRSGLAADAAVVLNPNALLTEGQAVP